MSKRNRTIMLVGLVVITFFVFKIFWIGSPAPDYAIELEQMDELSPQEILRDRVFDDTTSITLPSLNERTIIPVQAMVAGTSMDVRYVALDGRRIRVYRSYHEKQIKIFHGSRTNRREPGIKVISLWRKFDRVLYGWYQVPEDMTIRVIVIGKKNTGDNIGPEWQCDDSQIQKLQWIGRSPINDSHAKRLKEWHFADEEELISFRPRVFWN